jgi:diguanylate cyclase (GGDEF)-like protein
MASFGVYKKDKMVRDIATRASSGTLISLIVWFACGLYFDLIQIAPVFFLFFSGTQVLISILRKSTHYFIFKDTNVSPKQFKLLLGTLRASMLLSAINWSVIGSVAVLTPILYDFVLVVYLYMIGMAMCGSIVVCIDKRIRLIYPFLAITPILVALLFSSYPHAKLLSILGACCVPYLLSLSFHISKAYWTGLNIECDARSRANEYEFLANKYELLSQTDGLTGLYNRSFFNEYYLREWKMAGRQAYHLGVILIDLDHFKAINDTHGHIVGDECLREIGSALTKVIKRSGDIVARYGGEEFIMLVIGADKEATAKIVNKTIKEIRKLKIHLIEGKKVSLTCSIGYSSIIPTHNSAILPETHIDHADQALYVAKEEGRNRSVCFQDKPEIKLNLVKQ